MCGMDTLSLRHARTLLGWSQADMARAAGVEVGVIHRLENGTQRSTSIFRAKRIVNALRAAGLPGLTLESLVFAPSVDTAGE
jgi:transcriptional regulator with XRE-family HTH domain